jgi:hypothetical protein
VRPGPDGRAPADLVRPLLQHLADTAARAEGLPLRAVPVLAPHAVGDQLVVLARDVLALGGGPPRTGELEELADRLTALRRALP